MRQLVPTAVRVGVLVNPDNAGNTQTTLREWNLQPVPWGCKFRR